MLFLFFSGGLHLNAQKEYPSLLWEISGNGLEKPSYLFGTMHVSSKTAFYLGTPFFEALESSDFVALELEPEDWFDEVLEGSFINSILQRTNFLSTYGLDGRSWNRYQGMFKQEEDSYTKIKGVYGQSTEIFNELLFRFYDATGNFEEDTWLDMYIYQSAKKLKKETLGLETFEFSTKMLNKAYAENDEDEGPKLDYKEMMEIQNQIEPAYRNGDLDLLDSLTMLSSSKGFIKYLLVERNKKFVIGMDSIMQKKSLFTAVGAAHLAGENGCIEMLREMGYTLKPIHQGSRDAKSKKNLDKMILKRELIDFTADDKLTSFKTPYKGYGITVTNDATGVISMDIVNGLTFVVNRFMSFETQMEKTNLQLMAEMDPLLYEIIPGEILSKKSIVQNGFPGFEILNRTRRGAIHRSRIIFAPDEIIIARLSSTGDKIKKGLGDYFFSSLKVEQKETMGWEERTIPDQSLRFTLPGKEISYGNAEDKMYGEYFAMYRDDEGNEFHIIRKMNNDIGFLDEDIYDLGKISKAIRKDWEIELIESSADEETGRTRLRESYSSYKEKKVFAEYQIVGMASFAFIALCEDEAIANKFFDSISFHKPVYEKFYDHADSSCFFTSVLPWETMDDNSSSRMVYNIFGNDQDEVNDVNYYNNSSNLRTPGSQEEFNVHYERYGKYSYSVDSINDWLDRRRKEIHLYDDLIVAEEKEEVGDHSYSVEYTLADTGTARRYYYKEFLHNHSIYVIASIYDSIIGFSDFGEKFISEFEMIEDSLSRSKFFKEKNQVLLDDLSSSDTTTFELAENNIELVWDYETLIFNDIFKQLKENPSPLADEDDIEYYRENYRASRYAYTDRDTILNLKKEYLKSSNSSSDQLTILSNLLNMKTDYAIRSYKELITKEPPIVDSYDLYQAFSGIYDSLEFAKVLFPDMFDLLEFEEYQPSITRLLANCIDSSIVKPSTYQSKLPYFLRKAKIELKKLSSGNDDLDAYEYNDPYYEIVNYWKILYPHKKRPEIAEYFKSCEESDNKVFIQNYASFLHKNEVAISDEMAKKILGDEDYTNYINLKEIDRLDLFDDSLDALNLFLEYRIKNSWYYRYNDNKIDSVIFISQQMDSIQSRKYLSINCKYLYEDKWSGLVVMVLQNDAEVPELDVLRFSKELDDEEDEEEFFKDLKDALIDRNRQNDYGGYQWGAYRDYDYDYEMYDY